MKGLWYYQNDNKPQLVAEVPDNTVITAELLIELAQKHSICQSCHLIEIMASAVIQTTTLHARLIRFGCHTFIVRPSTWKLGMIDELTDSFCELMRNVIITVHTILPPELLEMIGQYCDGIGPNLPLPGACMKCAGEAGLIIADLEPYVCGGTYDYPLTERGYPVVHTPNCLQRPDYRGMIDGATGPVHTDLDNNRWFYHMNNFTAFGVDRSVLSQASWD